GFIQEKIEVIEGDISRPDLGIDPVILVRLRTEIDLVINSSGLTDFNPDLRQALAINIDGTLRVLDFQSGCEHAALLHLSTCYLVGYRDGRLTETFQPNYTPKGLADFDAEREYQWLDCLTKQIELRAESDEITELLRQQVLGKPSNHGKS